MAGFWGQIKKLMLQSERSSPLNPAIHEIIILTKEESKDFDRWKNTIVLKKFVDWLNHEYGEYLIERPFSKTITFLNSPPSFGFMVHFSEMGYSKRDAVFIAQFFKALFVFIG